MCYKYKWEWEMVFSEFRKKNVFQSEWLGMAQTRKWCLNSTKREIKYDIAMAMTKLGGKNTHWECYKHRLIKIVRETYISPKHCTWAEIREQWKMRHVRIIDFKKPKSQLYS